MVGSALLTVLWIVLGSVLTCNASTCPDTNVTAPFEFFTRDAVTNVTLPVTLVYRKDESSFLSIECCTTAPAVSVRWYEGGQELPVWRDKPVLSPLNAGRYSCEVLSAGGDRLQRSYDIIQHSDESTCPQDVEQGQPVTFSYHKLNQRGYTELAKLSWQPLFLPCCMRTRPAAQARPPRVSWTYINDRGETHSYDNVLSDTAVYYASRQILTLVEPREDGIFRCTVESWEGQDTHTLQHDYRVAPNVQYGTSCSTVGTDFIGDIAKTTTIDGSASFTCKANVCSRVRLYWEVTWPDGTASILEGTNQMTHGMLARKTYSPVGFFGNYRTHLSMDLDIPQLSDNHLRATFACVMMDGIANQTIASKVAQVYGQYVELVETGQSVTLTCLDETSGVSDVTWALPDGTTTQDNTISVDRDGEYACLVDSRAIRVITVKVVVDHCPVLEGTEEVKGWSSRKCLDESKPSPWIFCCLKTPAPASVGTLQLAEDLISWTFNDEPADGFQTKDRGQFLLANVSGVYRCRPRAITAGFRPAEREIPVFRFSDVPTFEPAGANGMPFVDLVTASYLTCPARDFTQLHWYHNGQPIDRYPQFFSLAQLHNNRTLAFSGKVPGNYTCVADDCNGAAISRTIHAEYVRCGVTAANTRSAAAIGGPSEDLFVLSMPKTVARFRKCSKLMLECCAVGFDRIEWMWRSPDGQVVTLRSQGATGVTTIMDRGQVLLTEAREGAFVCTARKGETTSQVEHRVASVEPCNDECADPDKTFRLVKASQPMLAPVGVRSDVSTADESQSASLSCVAVSHCRFNTQVHMSWEVMDEEGEVVCSIESSERSDAQGCAHGSGSVGDEVDCEVHGAVSTGITCPPRYSVSTDMQYSRYSIKINVTLTIDNVTKDDTQLSFRCAMYGSGGDITDTINVAGLSMNDQSLSTKFDNMVKFWIIVGTSSGVILVLLLMLAVFLPVYCWPARVYCKTLCTDGAGIVDRSFSAFLCYDTQSKDDTQFALETLQEHLETHLSYTLCIPEREFTMGEVLNEQATQFMDDSRAVIAVISESSIMSGWCHYTLGAALRSPDLKVIVVLYKISSSSWRHYQENRLGLTILPTSKVKVIRWPRAGGCRGRSKRDERTFLYKLEYAMPPRPAPASVTLVNSKISALQY